MILCMTYLPTIMSSHSEADLRMCLHRSMVKMVLELLNIEVKEDMRAASITAIIKPLRPATTPRNQISTSQLFKTSAVKEQDWRLKDCGIKLH